MAVNKNALLRYRILDECFRDRFRRWSLDDLIEKVGDVLYEYEGVDNGIGRRTIQADIQMMRSDKLGYNAPIVVEQKKYYTYADKSYTITGIPLSGSDLARMSDAVEILRQFKGFGHFSGLTEVIQKLEDHVYAEEHHSIPVIYMEGNERLHGIERLDMLYRAIIGRQALLITYRSFKAQQAGDMDFHPWWLCEYKNRWFMVGVKGKSNALMTLALDRIADVRISPSAYRANPGIVPAEYYKNVVGVTVAEGSRPVNVTVFVTSEHAPYVETKPLHQSQQTVKRIPEGIIITMKVQLNFELEREILGYGEGMLVLSPRSLRQRIRKKVQTLLTRYDTFSM